MIRIAQPKSAQIILNNYNRTIGQTSTITIIINSQLLPSLTRQSLLNITIPSYVTLGVISNNFTIISNTSTNIILSNFTGSLVN